MIAAAGTPTRADSPGRTGARGLIDRWIYVFTAAGFVAVTLVGFIPDSVTKIKMVQAGQRPPFPAILHVHAALMGAFLLLLLVQTILAATGRTRWHRRLGLASVVIAPGIIVAGAMLVRTSYHWIWRSVQLAPPGARAELEQGLRGLDNIMLAQIRFCVLFALAMAVGLAARRPDPGLHKRMMILAIAPGLSAAFDRMTWLPTTLPASMTASELYVLASIAPMLLWDVLRNRALHRAYWIWLAGAAPLTAAVHALWDTPGWRAMARRLVAI